MAPCTTQNACRASIAVVLVALAATAAKESTQVLEQVSTIVVMFSVLWHFLRKRGVPMAPGTTFEPFHLHVVEPVLWPTASEPLLQVARDTAHLCRVLVALKLYMGDSSRAVESIRMAATVVGVILAYWISGRRDRRDATLASRSQENSQEGHTAHMRGRSMWWFNCVMLLRYIVTVGDMGVEPSRDPNVHLSLHWEGLTRFVLSSPLVAVLVLVFTVLGAGVLIFPMPKSHPLGRGVDWLGRVALAFVLAMFNLTCLGPVVPFAVARLSMRRIHLFTDAVKMHCENVKTKAGANLDKMVGALEIISSLRTRAEQFWQYVTRGSALSTPV